MRNNLLNFFLFCCFSLPIPIFAAGKEFLGAGSLPDTDFAHVADTSRVFPSLTLGDYASSRVKKVQSSSRLSTQDKERSQSFPRLEVVDLNYRLGHGPFISKLPNFKSQYLNRVAGLTHENDFVFYTLDPRLQVFTDRLVKEAKAPHVAIVVMHPQSGKILAIAEKSSSIKDLSLHNGFPAASLFKLITASAALDQGAVSPYSKIAFRGGTYTLNQWNYKPDRRKDTRQMSLAEALGRSCNPVFARVALRFLNRDLLRKYAQAFGFNSDIEFDTILDESTASIPQSDYELSRTAAGFGEVTISPVHAAAIAAGLGNGGLLPRPTLIDQIISPNGQVKYKAKPELLTRITHAKTAKLLLNMMEYTTTVGTSKQEFFKNGRPVLPGIEVAAKTGTLRGDNPPGINNWFIAVAPLHNPQVAISVIVVNPSGVSSKASNMGRRVLQEFFGR